MQTDYYAIKALSHSMLSCLDKNPMECKMRYVDDPPTLPPKDSAAFAMGHAVHCLALEPERFEERFAVAPKIDRRTKLGKARAEAFDNAHKDKTILDEHEYADAVACVQALHNHADFATIMAQPKRVEVEHQFDLFGHRFKARLDCIIDSMRLIVDIKTTDDASPDDWKWSAVELGYHRQQYIYQEALRQATGKDYRFYFAVVEKPKPSTRGIPSTVALYELDEETIEMAAQDTWWLVQEYETRIATNDWQRFYSKGIRPLRLPRRKVYEGE